MPRSAIVTGSARGIGQAIALRLAADGYDVCINDIAANEALAQEVCNTIKSMGRKSIVAIADVSKVEQVESLVRASVDALGPLHTMVANAGIVQVKPLLEVTNDDLELLFQVNVFGVHNCYAVAAKQMIKQDPLDGSGDGGATKYKLIAAASIAGYKAFKMLGPYSATKWAVRGLNEAFAMEMADHGITANAFAPGIVGTSMWELIDEKLGSMTGAKVGETVKKYSEEMIALKRTSVPEDVSNTVHFLASKDSDYMTGQTLIVDGGIFFT